MENKVNFSNIKKTIHERATRLMDYLTSPFSRQKKINVSNCYSKIGTPIGDYSLGDNILDYKDLIPESLIKEAVEIYVDQTDDFCPSFVSYDEYKKNEKLSRLEKRASHPRPDVEPNILSPENLELFKKSVHKRFTYDPHYYLAHHSYLQSSRIYCVRCHDTHCGCSFSLCVNCGSSVKGFQPICICGPSRKIQARRPIIPIIKCNSSEQDYLDNLYGNGRKVCAQPIYSPGSFELSFNYDTPLLDHDAKAVPPGKVLPTYLCVVVRSNELGPHHQSARRNLYYKKVNQALHDFKIGKDNPHVVFRNNKRLVYTHWYGNSMAHI